MSCPICQSSLDVGKATPVRDGGLKTLIKFSELRRDGLFNANTISNFLVHVKCRSRYTRRNYYGEYMPLNFSNTPSMTSAEIDDVNRAREFPFAEKCFICAQDINRARSKKELTLKITSASTKDAFMKDLAEDRSTPIRKLIWKRIKDVDLVNVGAQYHRSCYVKNIHKKSLKMKHRLSSQDVSQAMQRIFNFIESHQNIQFSIKSLKAFFRAPVPTESFILKKLMEKYNGRLYIFMMPGDSTVIELRQLLFADNSNSCQ
ncbi:uncharacterized protein LOC142987087 [Anticarsia gemmatalis]|uniref:uncharacterized protein LOC142987087 n=1 Tax=Anticarsia gemmatalis TaxID=129554 RepID=UPI003F765FE9